MVAHLVLVERRASLGFVNRCENHCVGVLWLLRWNGNVFPINTSDVEMIDHKHSYGRAQRLILQKEKENVAKRTTAGD